MARDVVYANNPSAYIESYMQKIAGTRDFGDVTRAKRTATLSDVPPEFRAVVKAAVGNADSFDTVQLEERLRAAESAILREDKGVFGKGLVGGLIGGPDGKISQAEEARAAKHDPVAKVFMQFIHLDHARLTARYGGRA